MWILVLTLWTLPPDFLSTKGAIAYTRSYHTKDECLEAGFDFIRTMTAALDPSGHVVGPIVKPPSFGCFDVSGSAP